MCVGYCYLGTSERMGEARQRSCLVKEESVLNNYQVEVFHFVTVPAQMQSLQYHS